MRKKKIAFISTMVGMPWGGSEELWSRAALVMTREGLRIGVNYQGCREVPGVLKELRARGCEVKFRKEEGRLMRRTVKRLFTPAYRSLVHGFFNQWQLARSYRWLEKFRPDLAVISLGDQLQGLEWMQQCCRRGIPYAIILQKQIPVRWPAMPVSLFEYAKAYEEALGCYVVSERNLEELRTQLGTPIARAKVVRNPFKVPYPVPFAWPAEDGTTRLACVARYSPVDKGQDILLEVMALPKWRSRPVTVDLFGDGPYRDYLVTRIAQLKLEKVRVRDFAGDIEAVWRDHHALVLPSRFEGLPLSVVEAMLCGRPCIVTDVGGSAELIEDAVHGFIAAAPDRRALDDAMELAWAARETWRLMGKQAYDHVRRFIGPDPAADLAAEVYGLLEACGKRGGKS